jgi:hypothetical protein
MPAVARASGPITAEGKRKVSQNARKHGFRAKVQILSPPQQAEIAETIQFFARDFPPQSTADLAILAQLGKAFWTLKQFDNLEAQQYLNPGYEDAVRRLSTLTRYRAHHERLFHNAMKALYQRFCTNKLSRPKPDKVQMDQLDQGGADTVVCTRPPRAFLHKQLPRLHLIMGGITLTPQHVVKFVFQRLLCLKTTKAPPPAPVPCTKAMSSQTATRW